jgi:AcrR family transcriptional regulator
VDQTGRIWQNTLQKRCCTVIRSKDTAMIIKKKALQMFREKGYSNITIDDICKAVEIAKSTFFYHYKNKDQLLSSFFDNEYQVTPEMFEMIATSDNSWDIFWACISQTIERSIEAGSEIISQIISGTMSGNQLSYFANDVKAGGVKLSRVRSVLLEGAQVKIVPKDLSAYKHTMLSGYNSGSKNIERIF